MSPCQISHWLTSERHHVFSVSPVFVILSMSCSLTRKQIQHFYQGLPCGSFCATGVTWKKIQPASLSLEEIRNGFGDSVHRVASTESRPVLRLLPWDTVSRCVRRPRSSAVEGRNPVLFLCCWYLRKIWFPLTLVTFFWIFFPEGSHCICILYFPPFS